MSSIHLVFHVSMLRKCMGDPLLVVPLDIIGISDSLSYAGVPVRILDWQVRQLQMKDMASVKVLW